MNRRRTLLGLGTIVFGASGFVASGAFTFGSEGSLGDSWVQVEGTNQAVDFTPGQTTDEGDGSESGDNGGDGGTDDGSTDDGTDDGTTDDGEETPEDDGGEEEPPAEEAPSDDDGGSNDDSSDDGGTDDGGSDDDDDDDTGGGTQRTRVQVVTDPNNSGNAVNTPGAAQWNGTLVDSDIVLGTEQGFFRGLEVRDANMNARNTLGTLDASGYPAGLIAFIIANVGPDGDSAGATATVSAQLYADGEGVETEQLRFPYRVVDGDGTTVSQGQNLLASNGVRLADGHVVELVVVVDTTTGTDEIEGVDNLRFFAEGVN